ncbi:hypothetical protein [Janthinobacterium sp. RB2R34]|uniref:hypothetical protein n=1 Tax=Janthinobacterium sp. RB2R34 TaxID=3424193 RepID=UPI003F1F54C9
MNSPAKNTLVMLSLCAALSVPMSAMAQNVSPDDAAFVAATKTVESAPRRLSEEPMLRSDVIKMVGYARGNYTAGGTLIARQVFDSLRSQFDITHTALPDGRMVLASINPDTRGTQRAAVLFDAQRKIQAIGLVNGHCQPAVGDAAPVCLPDSQAVLTVFLPAGTQQTAAAPLLVWARQLPSPLDLAEPEERQKIAKVEYFVGQPGKQGWEARDVPPGFPAALKPLLLPESEFNSSSSGGKIIAPAGLAGMPVRTASEAAAAGGTPVPDADMTLRSYATLESLVATYTELAKGAQIKQQGNKVVFSGSLAGVRYQVSLREQGKEDGVFINIASWRGK